jgi:hypothetical protein
MSSTHLNESVSMMLRVQLSRIATIIWIAAAPAAVAAPCAGFTDIDDTEPLCPSVDWLRNRAITLGCTSSTQYCPNEAAIRLSMAAFINRLGSALTPAFHYHEANGASLDLGAPPATVCATPVIAVESYPRSVHASGVVTGSLASAATARLTLVGSSDGGTTWTDLSAAPSSAGAPASWINVTAWKGNIPLAPDASDRVGLRVDSAAAGSAQLGSWKCQLQAIVVSQTGIGAPH